MCRSPASLPGTCRIKCTTTGVRNKISPVFKRIKTSQGHQIFSGSMVQLAEAYPLMVLLPSTLRVEQPTGPVVIFTCATSSALALREPAGANGTHCFALYLWAAGWGDRIGKTQWKATAEAAASQNSISEVRFPSDSQMPLHSCFS